MSFFAIVAAFHHERIGQTLDDRALGFPESLLSEASSSVRQIDMVSYLNVVLQGDILDFNILITPCVE